MCLPMQRPILISSTAIIVCRVDDLIMNATASVSRVNLPITIALITTVRCAPSILKFGQTFGHTVWFMFVYHVTELVF